MVNSPLAKGGMDGIAAYGVSRMLGGHVATVSSAEDITIVVTGTVLRPRRSRYDLGPTTCSKETSGISVMIGARTEPDKFSRQRAWVGVVA